MPERELEVEVGVRIDEATGLSFFGTDEVNGLIREGAVVVAIEPGDVILQELGDGEEDGSLHLTLSGLRLKVRLSSDT